MKLGKLLGPGALRFFNDLMMVRIWVGAKKKGFGGEVRLQDLLMLFRIPLGRKQMLALFINNIYFIFLFTCLIVFF